MLICTSFITVSAQQPAVILSDKIGWHKIGETRVEFKTEVDGISVIGADRFAYVKIRVDEAPIHLTSFDIYFDGGGKQNVSVGKEFINPGETQTVQLTGGERRIEKVTFVYKTVPNYKDKKAHIELWGMKTNAELKAKQK